jgi:hypothetical protein
MTRMTRTTSTGATLIPFCSRHPRLEDSSNFKLLSLKNYNEPETTHENFAGTAPENLPSLHE